MIDGTFNVHRRVFDDPMFQDEPFTRREAWLWLIATAVFRPYRMTWGKHVVLLQRGQLVASYAQMATAWGWHRDKVRSFLRRLKANAMIETDTPADTGKATPKGTPPCRVTICNYDKYQATPSDEATPQATPQATHKNEGIKNPSSLRETHPAHARAGACRLPANWEPDSMVWNKLTTEYGDRLDCQGVLEKFRDHWWASTKATAIKKDWNAALRTWFRREITDAQTARPSADQRRTEGRARLRAAAETPGLFK